MRQMQPDPSTTTNSMVFVYGFFVLFCLGLVCFLRRDTKHLWEERVGGGEEYDKNIWKSFKVKFLKITTNSKYWRCYGANQGIFHCFCGYYILHINNMNILLIVKTGYTIMTLQSSLESMCKPYNISTIFKLPCPHVHLHSSHNNQAMESNQVPIKE